MKIQRFDLYTILLTISNWIVFNRFLSSLTSGSAIWIIKKNDTYSIIIVGVFIFSFFVIFSNFAQLVNLFSSKDKVEKRYGLVSVAKKSISLLFLYVIFVFVSTLISYNSQV